MSDTNGMYPWGTVPIAAAVEDAQGNPIVGTLGAGVFWYNDQGKADHIDSHQGLSHDAVLSLCMDREGDLWVGTDGGGLNRVKRKRFRVLEGSLGRNIRSVCGDRQGGLWFANPGGNLFFSKDETLKSFGSERGLVDSSVTSVFVDRDQRVWVGTSFGGIFALRGDLFQRIPGSELLGPIAAIHQDRGCDSIVRRVDAQDLPEECIGILCVVERVIGGAAVTHADVEVTVVRAKLQDAALVLRVRLRDGQQDPLAGPAGAATPLLGVDGYYLNPNSKNQAAAVEVALYLTNKASQTVMMNEAGHVPARTDVEVTDPLSSAMFCPV